MYATAYENRLYKYRNHNFDAYWPLLDRSKINPGRCVRTEENPQVYGLSRLILFEKALTYRSRGHRASYKQKRRLKKIDENGEPTHSGYAALEVPYGQKFSAGRYVSQDNPGDIASKLMINLGFKPSFPGIRKSHMSLVISKPFSRRVRQIRVRSVIARRSCREGSSS